MNFLANTYIFKRYEILFEVFTYYYCSYLLLWNQLLTIQQFDL